MNPFVVNGRIPDGLFCDRVRETERITKAILNNSNILLTSPRRMGKTQLIRHVFDQKEIRENYYTFYSDIYATSSLEEFVVYLSKEIYSQLVPSGKKAYEYFISALRSLSGSFSYDPVGGVPLFNIKLGDITSPELTLEEIFSYLEAAPKRCVFAIDEFQRVGDYGYGNVEALLRTHIQRMTNCCFVFAGSNRHILENMFNSPSKPFYNSASQMFLDRIDRDIYIKFIEDNFDVENRRIEQDAAAFAYDLFEGHTYYVHSLMHEAFASSSPNDSVTKEFVIRQLDGILEDKEHSFSDQLSLLNYQQKEVLIAIAKEGRVDGVTSAAFIKKHNLTSPSSVQNALRTLLSKDIVTYESDARSKVYSVTDRYMGLWIGRKY